MAQPVYGHELVDQLVGYHKPKDERVADLLGEVRDEFKSLGHYLVNHTPDGPDQTLALRRLHEALMATTFNIVAHQDELIEEWNRNI